MKKTTTIAAAFLALAGIAGTAAHAADNDRRADRHGMRGEARFAATDTDSSGDVTFEEFAAAMKGRFEGADTDGDGKMTVGEIASALEKARLERRAMRMIKRFDTDGDGALSMAEIESRQKKMFALMDRNDDGKLVQEEMPRRGKDGRRKNRN